jgi:hypothetical protein
MNGNQLSFSFTAFAPITDEEVLRNSSFVKIIVDFKTAKSGINSRVLIANGEVSLIANGKYVALREREVLQLMVWTIATNNVILLGKHTFNKGTVYELEPDATGTIIDYLELLIKISDRSFNN